MVTAANTRCVKRARASDGAPPAQSTPMAELGSMKSPAARERRSEPTINEILVDPIVCALMLADDVDGEALEAMLRSAAPRARKRAGAPEPAP
jgi:hypothetical protein